MAIEAMEYNIEWYNIGDKGIDKSEEALNACKEALEQPAQEPYRCYWVEKGKNHCERNNRMGLPDSYTHPHQVVPTSTWQGLTDEERYLNEGRSPEEIEYAIAIEQALKQKNNR
jgi:hypothetical protein